MTDYLIINEKLYEAFLKALSLLGESTFIKVSKFQNEFVKSSFLPKYERKIVRISAL
jgi:hypothetical protein